MVGSKGENELVMIMNIIKCIVPSPPPVNRAHPHSWHYYSMRTCPVLQWLWTTSLHYWTNIATLNCAGGYISWVRLSVCLFVSPFFFLFFVSSWLWKFVPCNSFSLHDLWFKNITQLLNWQLWFPPPSIVVYANCINGCVVQDRGLVHSAVWCTLTFMTIMWPVHCIMWCHQLYKSDQSNQSNWAGMLSAVALVS